MKAHQYSRRTFLRGTGVLMAPPWLESFNVWGDEPRKKPASEAPVRLCVTFSGNGFQSKEWWAKGEGKAMELGRVLAPLNEFKEKLIFVRGLLHEEARKGILRRCWKRCDHEEIHAGTLPSRTGLPSQHPLHLRGRSRLAGSALLWQSALGHARARCIAAAGRATDAAPFMLVSPWLKT